MNEQAKEIVRIMREMHESVAQAARQRKVTETLLTAKNHMLIVACEGRNQAEIEKARLECIEVFSAVLDQTIASYAKAHEYEERLNVLKPPIP